MPAAASVLLLHVALAFPPGALPSATLAAAVAEAAAIWAPYGVAVDLAGDCEAPSDDTALLTVDVVTGADAARRPLWHPALGAIGFDAGGTPAPAITLFFSDIVRFVSTAHFFGVNAAVWPTSLRERVVGRVIGRVVAHEIGHYLLQTPKHAASGLMRPMHTADDFVSPGRDGFDLSRDTAAQLARRAAKEKGPADAGPSSQTIVKR